MIFLARLFREWFTGPGSQEYELARLLFAITVVCGLAFTGVSVWRTGTFDVVAFGSGMGGLLMLGGLGTAAKDVGAAKAVSTGAAR